MDDLSLFLLSLDNEVEILPTMTFFPKLPPEIRNIVWTFAAMEPEIFSVKIRRQVKESPSKAQQKKYFAAKSQMHFTYEASSGPIDSDGYSTPHSSLRAATKESRAAYFKVRSHEIQLLGYGSGNKIYFNPFVDVLHFDDYSSVFSHQLRQRLRRPLPFVTGLHHATKITFDRVPNDERIGDLAAEVLDDYEIAIKNIQQFWRDKGQEWKIDMGWKRAVLEEETKLLREMKALSIRRALGRVNGGTINGNAKIFHLPLTAEDLA